MRLDFIEQTFDSAAERADTRTSLLPTPYPDARVRFSIQRTLFEDKRRRPEASRPLPHAERGIAMAEDTPPPESPVSRFAHTVAALLERDPNQKLDNAAVSHLAREIFGSFAGHARSAYDSVEAGFNLYLKRNGIAAKDARAALEWLRKEQERLPMQSRRDQRQIDFQQFSTPPAEAFLVVYAAGIRLGMRVLETSAGTGNLATLARLAGASVDTNEIDPRRCELLTLQGFSPMSFDAERLDNLLPPDLFYDAVIMNPPFSATGGRVAGHRTTFGARHIEQALLRLKPGGRLAAIVGCGMALDRPGFREWWDEVAAAFFMRCAGEFAMSQPSTRSRLESVIHQFLRSLGRECSALKDGIDLHRSLGLTSDEGVLLVIDIEEALNITLPDDFNAVVDDSGKRGRRFGDLVRKINAFIPSEAGK